MVSIIIPVLNEEEQIPKIAGSIQEAFRGVAHEVVLADGGSSDKTVELGRKYKYRVIACKERGRAKQMNFGARHAAGDILYFLHADTIPPIGAGKKIVKVLSGEADAGCFRLRFDDDHPALRFYSWFTRFDVDLFRFGDQSLFIRAKLFQDLGGFDESLMVMEDQEIIRRIKEDHLFTILSDKVVTSARKYRENGVVRLQLIFALILLMYYCGISQKAIVHLYGNLLRK